MRNEPSAELRVGRQPGARPDAPKGGKKGAITPVEGRTPPPRVAPVRGPEG